MRKSPEMRRPVKKSSLAGKPRSNPKIRRIPQQRRSVLATEAILEAAAQLIESTGLTGLTIAKIAEVAGYGAGTVYDYFPTKKAILIAIARRELAITFQAIEATLLNNETAIDNDAGRRAIRAMIGGFGGRQRLRGVLLGTMIAEGYGIELAKPADRIAELLVHQARRLDGIDLRRMKSEQLFILTRALVGVIRAWSMEGATQVSAETLEIELTAVMRSYVRSCLM